MTAVAIPTNPLQEILTEAIRATTSIVQKVAGSWQRHDYCSDLRTVTWQVQPQSQASIQVKDWFREYAGETEKVREFCLAQKLTLQVKAAIHLVEHCFPAVHTITLRLNEDPEGGPQRLQVVVESRCAPHEVMVAYDKYLDQWIAASLWEAREKICLSYNAG